MARAIISPLPASPAAPKKKREEETRGGLMIAARRFIRHIVRRQFRQLADDLRQPVARRSILNNLYTFRPYDPQQERTDAEHILRTQLEEWAQEEDAYEQNSAFHYAANAGFDPHP